MNYFGYKLVMLSTLASVPVVYTIVPAHTDEREAAETASPFVHQCDILTDKGFIGNDWQSDGSRITDNRIFTSKRLNQHQQTPAPFARLLNHFRERIEGVFHEIQNTGLNLERLLRKKVDGFFSHVAAKSLSRRGGLSRRGASHTLRIFLRQLFRIDVLTFTQYPA